MVIIQAEIIVVAINNQQQATDKQAVATRHESAKRVKTTINKKPWQFKYANTITTVLCMSNSLIYGYNIGIYDE